MSSLSSIAVPLLAIHSTLVVAVFTPTELVVAADSLQRLVSATGVEAGETCKMYRVGDRAFALAGLVGNADDEAVMTQLAFTAVGQPGSVREQADAFLRLAEPALAAILAVLRSANPQLYRETIDGGNAGVSAMFIGKTNGPPAVSVRQLQVLDFKQSGPITPTTTVRLDCPGDCTALGFPTVMILGHQYDVVVSAAVSRFAQDPPTSLIDRARRVVDIGIDLFPDHIGGPADVLRVTSDGMEWITLKPSCHRGGDAPPQ